MVRKKLRLSGIPATCKLEMDFFRSLEIIAVSCNAIKSRTALSRDTWHVEWAGISFRCSFIVRMKSNKDTRYKQTNCRPDYILDRIDSWCRFWKLSCFVIRTWPTCLCIGQIDASTCPPLATPRAFDFLENYCSNFPLPGPKCHSNAPH